jgi:hypothetical protein
MNQIILTLHDRAYIIGYATSLKSFIALLADEGSITEVKEVVNTYGSPLTSAFHVGHNCIVSYHARKVVDNSRCFYPLNE